MPVGITLPLPVNAPSPDEDPAVTGSTGGSDSMGPPPPVRIESDPESPSTYRFRNIASFCQIWLEISLKFHWNEIPFKLQSKVKFHYFMLTIFK